jgi:hypothetical protein
MGRTRWRPASIVLGVAYCSSAWPTATLGQTDRWVAATLGSSIGPSTRGVRAYGDGAARGIAALARGGGATAGALWLESMTLWRGLDDASTCVGVNNGVR